MSACCPSRSIAASRLAVPRRPLERRSWRTLDALDAIVVAASDDAATIAWQSLPRGACAARGAARASTLRARRGAQHDASTNAAQTLAGARVAAARCDARSSARRSPAACSRKLRVRSATRLGVSTVALPAQASHAALEALARGNARRGRSTLPSFKSAPRDDSPAAAPDAVRAMARSDASLRVTHAASAGNNLARWLTALPPNELDARAYRERIAAPRASAKAGACVPRRRRAADASARVRSSPSRRATRTHDAGIAHLRYRACDARAPRARVALVGKGICFDTGGTNLKAHRAHARHAHRHGRAARSRSARCSRSRELQARRSRSIAGSRSPRTASGPRAYRPQDVVQASNGVTIQVIHTDAEGRMVLADTLALAARAQAARSCSTSPR